jgi:hypothetical protein
VSSHVIRQTLEQAQSVVTTLMEKRRTFVQTVAELFELVVQYLAMWKKYMIFKIIPEHHSPQGELFHLRILRMH